MIGRLGGIVLLVLGVSSGWFALAGDYTVLMNPAFRWVTIVGAGLLLALGAVQIASRRGGSTSALLVFGVFFAVVGFARPHAGGVAPLFPGPGDLAAVVRAGYQPFQTSGLFENLDTEAASVPSGRVVVRGFVKRLPELDATSTFVLLQPQMACCLADVLALGVRVQGQVGALPDDGAWIHAFGQLEVLGSPISTPSFRVGAILFVAVSRVHVLQAHEIVSHRSTLPTLFDRTPTGRCSTFRTLAIESGLVDILRREGPFTLLVPLNASFELLRGASQDGLLRNPEQMRAFLEGLIIPGRIPTAELYGVASLRTLGGTTLTVRSENGKLSIGGARVVFGDQEACNGTVHLVHPIPTSGPADK